MMNNPNIDRKKLKITMFIEVNNDSDVETVKCLEHHVENLLDLDSWPEIKSVYGVKIEEAKE